MREHPAPSHLLSDISPAWPNFRRLVYAAPCHWRSYIFVLGRSAMLCFHVFGVQFWILPAELFSVTPRQRGVYPQFYIESDATVARRLSWASRPAVPAWGVRRTCGDKWQLYLCVLHESIKHWPFKNAPRIFEAVRSRGPNWDAA